MAILHILLYPDPKLRCHAVRVKKVDSKIRKLVDDMFETMYEAPGVGLAAPQVDQPLRLMVIDISEDKSEPLCFINPEIISQTEQEKTEEGCLSVPGVYEDVMRAAEVRVKALDKNGEAFEMDTAGLLAVCVQHEIDHLDGKLFVDYLSPLKRKRIEKKMEKVRRHNM